MGADNNEISSQERQLSTSEIRSITDSSLKDEYIAFQKDKEEKETHDITDKTKGELRGLKSAVSKDQVEEEIVRRNITGREEEMEKLFKDGLKDKLSKSPESSWDDIINKDIVDFLKKRYDFGIRTEDLQSLRDDLPIIDGFKDGMFYGAGKVGEAHSVRFNDFDIEKTGDDFTFVYKVYVKLDGPVSPEFKDMVEEEYLDICGTQQGGHRFDVVLSGEPDWDPNKVQGSVPSVMEVENNDPRLQQHFGVLITGADGSKTILIARDRSQEQKRQTFQHELSHLCGMVSESPDLASSPDKNVLLGTTGEEGSDDWTEKREEHQYAIIEEFKELVPPEAYNALERTDQQGGNYGQLLENLIVEYKARDYINISDGNWEKFIHTIQNALSTTFPSDITLNTKVSTGNLFNMRKWLKKYAPNFKILFDNLKKLSVDIQGKSEAVKQIMIVNGKIDFNYLIAKVPRIRNLVYDSQSLKSYINTPGAFENIRSAINGYIATLDRTPVQPILSPEQQETHPVTSHESETAVVPVSSGETAEISEEVRPVTYETSGEPTTDGDYSKYFIRTIMDDLPDSDIQNREKCAREIYKTEIEPNIIKPTEQYDPQKYNAFKVEKEGVKWKVTYMKIEDESQGLKATVGEWIDKMDPGLAKFLLGIPIIGWLLTLAFKWTGREIPTDASEAEALAQASKAAFEKLNTGLTPDVNWFKTQPFVAKPTNGKWDEAWAAFFISDVLKYTKYSTGKGNTDATAVLTEAKAFHDRADKNQNEDKFYEERHTDKAKEALDAAKKSVTEGWDKMKTNYASVDIDVDNVAPAFLAWQAGDTAKAFNNFIMEKTKGEIRETFVNWCTFIKSKNEKLTIEKMNFVSVMFNGVNRTITEEEFSKAYDAYDKKFITVSAAAKPASILGFIEQVDKDQFLKDEFANLLQGKWKESK